MGKRKGFIIALSALVLGIAIVVVVRPTAQREQRQVSQQRVVELEQRERSGRLHFRERVELARARGQRQLVVPAVINNYSLDMPASPDAADQVLPNYTVVLAQLIEKKSYMRDDVIGGTWNKFRIIETLSQAPPQPSHGTWSNIPEEWLPARDNEILMHSHGGTVTIDGVEVKMNDSSVPPFQQGRRYVLVLSLDPSTRVGEMALGLYGFLPINLDDTLDARRDQHYLQQVIKTHHGGSIGQLRNALRIRSGSR